MRKYNEAALTLEKLNSNSVGRVSERGQISSSRSSSSGSVSRNYVKASPIS
jgi:hypothetical protein